MLKIIFLAFCFLFLSLSSYAEVNDIGGTFTRPFRAYWQPGFDLNLSLSSIGSSSIKTSPRVFTRFKIEQGHVYFSPDLGAGVMTGLNGGSPVFLTGGFTAGYREAPPTVGWFGGLVCDSFLGGSTLTGVAARVGFDMDYDMTGAQFFTELRTGVMMESPSGVTNSYLYFAIHSGVQFLIDF